MTRAASAQTGVPTVKDTRHRAPLRRSLRVLVAIVVAAAVSVGGVVVAASGATRPPSLEELRAIAMGDYVSTIATPRNSDLINPDYDRSYDNHVERNNSSGLLHPGILLSREELNVMRDMVWVGAEPWASAFAELRKSPYAQLDYKMDGPFSTITSDRETYSLTRASTAAYELTLMWYITGKAAYAEKAKDIILQWSQTLTDDVKYDHLRMGTATHKLAIAAEIMRYTPSSGWNANDTRDFNSYLDLVDYALDKPYQYLNQGGYALIGYIGSAIFRDDATDYARAVEREAYNVEGGWKDGNSVNFSLSSMVFNDGSFVEMGRDQWHAIDNMGTHSSVIKTTAVQGTKVDAKGKIVKVGGTDLYDYGNEKLLKMTATLAGYNAGEETPFVASKNAWGDPTEFPANSSLGRGAQLWEPSIYYHYRYAKNHAPDDERTVVNATTGPDQTIDPYATYGDAYRLLTQGRDAGLGRQTNVDFPDFTDLTFTPLAAIGDTPLAGPPSDDVDLPNSFSEYNRVPGGTFSATGNDTRAVTNDGRNGGAISEPYADEDGATQFMTSDVNNGEWIAYSLDLSQQFGSTASIPTDTIELAYGTNSSGGDIDVYLGNYVAQPTQANYQAAVDAGKIGTVRVQDTQGYLNHTLVTQRFPDAASRLTGKVTVYLYFYNSTNVYKFHANTAWLKFVSSRAVDVNTPATPGFVSSNAAVSGDTAAIANGGSIGWRNLDFDRGYSSVTVALGDQPAQGSLAVFDGDPANDGTKVETIDLAGATGTVTIPAITPTALQGRHNLYLQYTGQGTASLKSIAFAPVASGLNSYANVPATDYLAVVQGDVTTQDESITLHGDTNPYVTYNEFPFLSGPSTIGLRVRTHSPVTLHFDQLNVGDATGEDPGRGGNLASIDVPDTYALADDGWVTVQTKLTSTGAMTGNNMVGLGILGDQSGDVEFQYLRFNPDNAMPQATLTSGGATVTGGETIVLADGDSASYELGGTDADGNAPSVQFAQPLPAGFSAVGSTLTVTAPAGSYPIKAVAYDGDSANVATFTFRVRSGSDEVDEIIADSGISANLLSLYMYARPYYDGFATAKTTAVAEASTANLTVLRTAIDAAMAHAPVYTQVRFGYRAQSSPAGETSRPNDTIQLFADTTEAALSRQDVASGKLLATTGRLPEKTNANNSWAQTLRYTPWIPFQTSLAGAHTLTVQTDHWSTRVSFIELSNADGTRVKRIDAISYTQRGHSSTIMEKANDPNAAPDDIGMYGASSWLRYTLDQYDLRTFTYANKGQPAPLEGKTGSGVILTLVPEVQQALARAATAYANRAQYTPATAAGLTTAYEAAAHAVDAFAEVGLTPAMSQTLAGDLDQAVRAVQLLGNEVTVTLPTATAATLDASGNNGGNLGKPNLSRNPTITALVGAPVTFLLNVPDGAAVELKEFGFRGFSGDTPAYLTSVDPAISQRPTITKIDGRTYQVQWSYQQAGNFRGNFVVTAGDATIAKSVEVVLRNATDRSDLRPEYARIRFNAFQADKTIDVLLVPVDAAGNPDASKPTLTTSFTGLSRTGGKFVLSQWVKLPDDIRGDTNYTVVMKAYSTYIYVDFLEFATGSYRQLYPSASYDTGTFQSYPLSASGVLRIEAEHYDQSNVKDYTFIDFNGRRGFENGNPGAGAGAIRVGGIWNQNNGATVEYRNVKFAAAATAAGPISLTFDGANQKQAYLLAGADPAQLTALVGGQPAVGVSYASDSPSVATVDANGAVTGVSFGTAELTALTASHKDTVTAYVADRDHLAGLITTYDTYIAGHQEDYTPASWNALAVAYAAATQAVDSADARVVYEATAGLKSAVDERKWLSNLTALHTYQEIAGSLVESDYEPAGWATMASVLSSTRQLTANDDQALIDDWAGKLQRALYGLVAADASKASTTALAALVQRADAIIAAGQHGYSDEVWAQLGTALDLGHEVLAAEKPQALQVRVATEGLQAALEARDRENDLTRLETLHEQYKRLSADKYTPASWAPFKTALDAAAAILADSSIITPQAVENAATALESAAQGLVLKPVVPQSPAWDSTKVYNSGDRVSYNGAEYLAQWWTQGEKPGSTATGSWMEQGKLVEAAGTGMRAWTRSWVYTGGETVAYNGHEYRAKWWTRNQQPGDPNGPWQDLGTY